MPTHVDPNNIYHSKTFTQLNGDDIQRVMKKIAKESGKNLVKFKKLPEYKDLVNFLGQTPPFRDGVVSKAQKNLNRLLENMYGKKYADGEPKDTFVFKFSTKTNASGAPVTELEEIAAGPRKKDKIEMDTSNTQDRAINVMARENVSQKKKEIMINQISANDQQKIIDEYKLRRKNIEDDERSFQYVLERQINDYKKFRKEKTKEHKEQVKLMKLYGSKEEIQKLKDDLEDQLEEFDRFFKQDMQEQQLSLQKNKDEIEKTGLTINLVEQLRDDKKNRQKELKDELPEQESLIKELEQVNAKENIKQLNKAGPKSLKQKIEDQKEATDEYKLATVEGREYFDQIFKREHKKISETSQQELKKDLDKKGTEHVSHFRTMGDKMTKLYDKKIHMDDSKSYKMTQYLDRLNSKSTGSISKDLMKSYEKLIYRY